MATDLIMPTPRAADHAQSWLFLPPSHRHNDRSHSFRAASGPRISPHSISDASSNQTNSYPSSPTGVFAHKGRPVYIPAVLRPCDEFPSKKIFQPGSSVSDSDSDSPLRRVNSNIINLAALGHRLTRRSSADSAKAFAGDWNLDSYPEVTDLPTRIHWKPDPQSSVCDDPTCKRGFSYFVRRHHCRKCGDIFCDWHSSFFLPLDQDANFNPRAALSRACNHCFQEVKASQGRRDAQPAGTLPPNALLHTTASVPMMARPTGATMATTPCASDVAASVPRDWNWSTF
ncbi:hypothetical protein XA68_13937 [Ophiocordyceps unilateralis]|uniref:FYVE-type domain-containing protein n=1 Tax=Ophiocordyceps unilateralis TaxID=268505 RepID=A0A2A9PAE1_OPHUN|nr:hypothetical protein XA68_13937 [Ophiocordyceps unilateralis]